MDKCHGKRQEKHNWGSETEGTRSKGHVREGEKTRAETRDREVEEHVKVAHHLISRDTYI